MSGWQTDFKLISDLNVSYPFYPFPKFCENRRKLPCLDGLRCISILLVLLAHSQRVPGFPDSWRPITRWLPDGGFGVQVFFVISGFLITWLLMREVSRSGKIHLGAFYTRRAFRILPAYSVFLVTLFFLQRITALEIPIKSWVGLLTYLTNFIETPWIAAHVWSLSVEEQFYLLWPFLFALAVARTAKLRILLALLLIPILMSPLMRVLGYLEISPTLLGSHSFLLHADALAFGCLTSVIISTFAAKIDAFLGKHRWRLGILTVVLVLVPLVLTRLFVFGIFTVPFGKSCFSGGIALALVLALRFPESRWFAWLNWRVISTVGLWSYSIYLWQQIFCTSAACYGIGLVPWWLAFLGWLAPVFVCAIVSYYGVERPFLRLKNRLSNSP